MLKKFLFIFAICFSKQVLANDVFIFKNIPTNSVLNFLASEFNKNIVITNEIKGNVNLRLNSSNFDQLLNIIAKANNLNITKNDNIYFISSITNQTNEPLIYKSIHLRFSKALDIFQTLSKGNGVILSTNGYLNYDDLSNNLIIKDTPSNINSVLNLIKILDKPTKQIAIEARIVTISSENLQELGVRWGLLNKAESSQELVGGFIKPKGVDTTNFNVNLPVSNAAKIALQVASINSHLLDLELSALEQENNVEIIASPRLLTTNKKTANIKQGTEIPYIVDKKIEFKEAVLGLKVTPQITDNNQVLLDLTVTQNTPNSNSVQGSNSNISINKQELNTQVFVKNGETIVLGGIFQHLLTKGEGKVPFLGSIPLINHLFKSKREQLSKRELVIFVTPYIIDNSDQINKISEPLELIDTIQNNTLKK